MGFGDWGLTPKLQLKKVLLLATTLERNVGIDVARAGLIIMMLVFHSFGQAQLVTTLDIDQNYNVNRWMGQVTGSFPFLIGFLLGFRYLVGDGSGGVPVRPLISRALKLIALFFVLNILLILVDQAFDDFPIPLPGTPDLQSLILADPGLVAYDLLMPLGEIVLIGAVLLKVRTVYQNDRFMRCSLAVAAIIMALFGNLTVLYLACGMMGLGLGSWFANPDNSIILRDRWQISLLGLLPGIILAITEKNGPDNGLLYLISISGLFFAFHNLGRFALWRKDGWFSRVTNRFARGSLMIYLVHIPILPFLAKFSGPLFSQSDLWLAFFALLAAITVNMGCFVYFMELYQPRINQSAQKLKLVCNRVVPGVSLIEEENRK